MLGANKAKRDKIKTIIFKMTPRFLISDNIQKKNTNMQTNKTKYVRRKQFKKES